MHRVTLIPGDGTGPELTEATRRVLEATGVEFDWDVQHAGTDVMEKNGGNPLPTPPFHDKGVFDYAGKPKPAADVVSRWFHQTVQFGP